MAVNRKYISRGGDGWSQHRKKQRRSIHDIRLNEYMNFNEPQPLVALINRREGIWLGLSKDYFRTRAQVEATVQVRSKKSK